MEVFYKQDDMQMRVCGGVAMARGEPVMLLKYDGRLFTGRSLFGGEVKLMKEEVDLTPVSTGNVTVGNTYVYTSRIPHRKYKQTLSSDAIHQHKMPFEVAGEVGAEGMLQPITNRYPKLNQALFAVANKLAKAMPFSREWGVCNKDGVIVLCYRDMAVGVVGKESIKLYADKFYLEQLLREVLDGQV